MRLGAALISAASVILTSATWQNSQWRTCLGGVWGSARRSHGQRRRGGPRPRRPLDRRRRPAPVAVLKTMTTSPVLAASARCRAARNPCAKGGPGERGWTRRGAKDGQRKVAACIELVGRPRRVSWSMTPCHRLVASGSERVRRRSRRAGRGSRGQARSRRRVPDESGVCEDREAAAAEYDEVATIVREAHAGEPSEVGRSGWSSCRSGRSSVGAPAGFEPAHTAPESVST
jgi:hypothetical protein